VRKLCRCVVGLERGQNIRSIVDEVQDIGRFLARMRAMQKTFHDAGSRLALLCPTERERNTRSTRKDTKTTKRNPGPAFVVPFVPFVAISSGKIRRMICQL